MASKIDELATTLRDEVGDELRTVFYGDFKTREYQVVYADEEILSQYSPEDTKQIVDDISLEQVGASRQESLFEPIGSLEFTVRYFEDGINVMAWGFDDIPTIYIGLGDDEATVPRVIEIVRSLSDDD
ncbi:hypothetical protein SAMN04487949_2447 [Halogranum gelatinilyticum]|uniref:Uncharacterized protein n=1 Tax=Halogranum gelatinilyticum TaxID=660521 RepID=A0A1G9VP35_9EURY|nr:hypothetical protein [Halogranum gelatinilyticum]SDM73761.1 hypothetical protein SAMN04487949_2447 [Halogranum gelatinilyticum]